MNIIQDLTQKKTAISVIGLGYVGLPIALAFAKHFRVIGFDIRPDRVEMLNRGEDPSREIDSSGFLGTDIVFTSNPGVLKQASFHIVAVPTPIDDSNMPDLQPLLGATSLLADVLKKGDYVVYESTVYPGATEEDCVPILESRSGLKYCVDFKVGYSPERINPGDKVHTLQTIIKVVSGCDKEALEVISNLYSRIVAAGVHPASSIKVAEASKIIENTQRDVNIALMNELSIIFNRMGINTYEVLEAAGTKWNFLKFYPGLVGGHCIGVDPYYLTYKAKKLRYHAQVITSGRFVNDSMGFYTAKQLVKKIIASGKNVLHARVLILGITFKEDVSDIRNSRVPDIYTELRSYGVNVDVVDPFADPQEVKEEYGIELRKDPLPPYDAVVVAVSHKPYVYLTENELMSYCGENPILVDVKGIYRGKIERMTYWSL